MIVRRSHLAALFALAIGFAQFRESGDPALAAHLELTLQPRMPARVYLFKDGRPFRLSPVQAVLPLRVDLFYRERLWRNAADPDTLEVTCNDFSHFLLLKGRGSYDLPAGKYRIEAYRGLFYTPFTAEFELKAGETRNVEIALKDWTNGAAGQWLSGDDHIHLIRSREDDPVFLSWLEAEDLSAGNFLQLQRQLDAAAQYGFGPQAEARRPGYSIRSGHESRSEYFGHINFLGGRQIIRPLSIGTMYANSPLTDHYPAILFQQGRAAGAATGYAHFSGSTPHSAMLMDLALGNIDFLEVFQFGVLKKQEWYQLWNAGFRITGIAGSDFPVPLNRTKDWPRYIPLLGPERTLVRKQGAGSAFEGWVRGVKSGDVVVSNGPLLEFSVTANTARATARFFRPLEAVEIVVNGQVVAAKPGDGSATELSVTATVPEGAHWAAARTTARKLAGEPDIQAHTNAIFRGMPVDPDARAALARQWQAEVDWYRTGPLVFSTQGRREEFFARATKAMEVLRKR
ncbi:MAG: CehA/McbA family metallohydrolase [Bryobacteraceae bacterium]|nr:CehA/McbA family metallohydrolase [Bryobacteraceae bacterium]